MKWLSMNETRNHATSPFGKKSSQIMDGENIDENRYILY